MRGIPTSPRAGDRIVLATVVTLLVFFIGATAWLLIPP